jgi:FlaA1/EpsC-like NDP-sugar epimerase
LLRRSASFAGKRAQNMCAQPPGDASMSERTVGLEHGLTNYGDRDFSLYLRRSFARSMGYSRSMLAKPVVGIAYTSSGFNNCHRHFPELLDAVKRGVLAAGALPIEFPTISLGEVFLSPTSLKYRNLMSIDTEEMIRAQPMDAVVLIGGCDKTVPALLMGAASANVPAILMVTGPMITGDYHGERLGACTDCRRFWARFRAKDIGEREINEIEGRGDMELEIKGFVDDDRMKLGRGVVKGLKVLGSTEDLPDLVRSLGIDHVVITIAQASRQDIQRVVKMCEEIPIKVRIIPGLYEILDGRVEITRIRDVQIEDLLGREPVQLDIESIRKELAGKTVMVTGAGGSIGSELARQVVRFSPAKLLLVERAEFALFNIDRALSESDSAGSVVPLVADIGDLSRMRSIFQSYRPQVVIHAAAHKHVPLMESNPAEAIKNNVLNTRLLSELSAEFKAEVFVLISTDKAVRPTSIMGASKRIAELVTQDAGRLTDTRFVSVRFGNVIGSNGSAIPIFQEQIRKGGPVKITDKRMQRYFMTIPEAAQLVLQASTIGKSGQVLILHMGEPVSILELAEALILLSGLKPHQDIKIIETGMRPGEKLYEELTFDNETAVATSHPKIFISRIASLERERIQMALEQLTQLVHERNAEELRRFLNKFIPEARLTTTAVTTCENGSEPGSEAFVARYGSF